MKNFTLVLISLIYVFTIGHAQVLHFELPTVIGAGDTTNMERLLHIATTTASGGIEIRGNSFTNDVQIELSNGATGGRSYTLESTGGTASIGTGRFVIRDQTGGFARMVIDETGNTGFDISSPDHTVHIGGTGALIKKSTSTSAIHLNPDNNAKIFMTDLDGNENVKIFSDETGRGGTIRLTSDLGNEINLVTNFANSGDSRIITDEIQIKGGSDVSEMFDIIDDTDVVPGMLMSISPREAGQLVTTTSSYDRNVIGIVSGANGIKPGVLMGQEGTIADGQHAVTLSGRTYVLANDESGSIRPGDLLTTSSQKGYAMKAKKKKKARGAIIGKAMTPLNGQEGYVLVLVNLQ